MKTTRNIIILAVILNVILISCQCVDCAQPKKINPPKTQQNTVGLRKTFSDAYPYDEVRHVNEKGIHYIIIYYTGNGVAVVNYSKDSLEIASIKRQMLKDSLQIEAYK
jgi:hypothetical protein